MEKEVNDQENKIKVLEPKVASLEEITLNLKLKIQKAIENAVRGTTKELVNTLIKNQDIAEKRNETMLNSINGQIAMLTQCLASPKHDDSNPEQLQGQSENHDNEVFPRQMIFHSTRRPVNHATPVVRTLHMLVSNISVRKISLRFVGKHLVWIEH